MKQPEQMQISWWRPRLDRETLRSLTRRSDWRGLVQSLGILALWTTTGLAAFHAWRNLSVGWLILALFVHGTFYTFSGSAFHELTHGTVFKSRWLNELFLRIFAFVALQNNVFFRESHTRHHACTLHAACDGEVVNPEYYSLGFYLRRAIIDVEGAVLQVWKILRYSVGIIPNGWATTCFPEIDVEKRRRLIRWARILLLGHGALAAVSIATGLWIIPVLITFGRFYGDWLHWLVNKTQHTGLRANIPDWRISCRTFYAGPLLRFLYWNMNYHIEHHTFAAVPFFNLARLHAEMKHLCPEPKPSLVAVWREIIQVQRRRRAGETAFCETRIPAEAS